MIIRKYYIKGGIPREEIILSKEEQQNWTREFMNNFLNPYNSGFRRYILDNLEHLCEYRVWWNNYGKYDRVNPAPEPKAL